jgi:hypothetical protein
MGKIDCLNTAVLKAHPSQSPISPAPSEAKFYSTCTNRSKARTKAQSQHRLPSTHDRQGLNLPAFVSSLPKKAFRAPFHAWHRTGNNVGEVNLISNREPWLDRGDGVPMLAVAGTDFASSASKGIFARRINRWIGGYCRNRSPAVSG